MRASTQTSHPGKQSSHIVPFQKVFGLVPQLFGIHTSSYQWKLSLQVVQFVASVHTSQSLVHEAQTLLVLSQKNFVAHCKHPVAASHTSQLATQASHVFPAFLKKNGSQVTHSVLSVHLLQFATQAAQADVSTSQKNLALHSWQLSAAVQV